MKSAIADLRKRFRDVDRAVRWTRPEQMHLTLKFLGDVSDAQLPAVCEAVRAAAARQSPLELTAAGVGCFPGGGPVRVLWVGVGDTSRGLMSCQAAAESAVEPLGFPREARAFSAHLTLGRVKDASASARIRQVLPKVSFGPVVQAVDEIVLYESQLSSAGSRYVAVCRAPLTG